jgi:hypothetical protein
VQSEAWDSTTMLPTAQWKLKLQALKNRTGGYTEFEPVDGMETVFDEQQLVQMSAARSEEHLDVLLTPNLRTLVEKANPGFSLINSETVVFLKYPGAVGVKVDDNKPVNHVSPLYARFLVTRKVSKDLLQQVLEAKVIYGGVFLPFYRDMLLIETKLQIKPEDFMQLLRYLEWQSSWTKSSVKGMIVDSTHAYLMEAEHTVVISLVKVEWAAAGSEQRIKEFCAIRPSALHVAITRAQREQKVKFAFSSLLPNGIFTKQPASETKRRQASFLGRGAEGCVFRVTLDEKQFALKVVVANEKNPSLISRLNSQYTFLQENGAALATCVVGVVQDSYKVQLDESGVQVAASMLLTSVGIPLSTIMQQTGQTNKKKLALMGATTALCNVHALGFCHGDARVANVVAVDDQVKWIDLQALISTPTRQMDDRNKFLKSLDRFEDVYRQYVQGLFEQQQAEQDQAEAELDSAQKGFAELKV